MTAADHVRFIRGNLPKMIADRATERGCQELLDLARVVPAAEATWLRWIHKDAVTNVRRNLWLLPDLEAVKITLADSSSRMLRSDDDLLELVVESLGRLQTKLKRQSLPRAEDLWLWQGAGLNRTGFRPKDEDAVSDYVANWLLEDIGPEAGVVVNREVQPRRGSRTDIIVEVTTPSADAGFDRLTVVVEVKGCWHPDLRTGLESQLVGGYLQEHGWRCGLYLVGWFVCPQWGHPENRLLGNTLEAAREEIATLAAPFDGVGTPCKVNGYLLDCTLPLAKAPSA